MKKDSTIQNQKKNKSKPKSEGITLDFATSIINSVSDAVIVTNLKGEIAFWNDGAVEIYGYTSEEALGKNISFIYRKQDLLVLGERIKKVIQGENFSNTEATVIDKFKNEHTVLLSINGIKDEEGNVIHLVGFTKDITELKNAQRTIFESEQRFKLLYQGAEIGVSYYSKDGIIIDFNDISLKRVNKKKAELIGKPIKDAFPDIYERIQERINLCVKSKKSQQHEGSFDLGGNVRWFLNVYSPYANEEGAIIGVQIITVDITDQKHEESELLKAKEAAVISEKYLENIINHIGDSFFVKDEQSRLLLVNDAFCKIFGLTRDNIIGKTLAEDVSPDERKSFLKIDKQVLKTGQENIFEESLTVRGGQAKTISTRKSRYIDNNGNKYLIGVIRDITERKHAENALRESEQNYRSIFEQSMVGIGMSKENEVVFANTAMLQMFKYNSLEEFKKVPLIDHIAPSSRQLIENRIKIVLTDSDENMPSEYQYDILCRDGEIKTLQAHTSPVEIKGQRYSQTITIDITQQKLAEQTLKESEQRFEQAFDNSPIPISILDLKAGKRLAVNNVFCKAFGYTESELIDEENIHKLNLAVSPKEFKLAAKKCLAEGTIMDYPISMYTKSGEIRNVLLNATKVYATNDDVFIVSFLDITDRKVAEEHLKETFSQLDLVVNTAKLGVWSFDVNTGEVIWNDRQFEIHGIAPSEFDLTLESYNKLVHPEDLEYLFDQQGEIYKNKSVHDINFRIIRPDKSVRYISASAAPVNIDGELDRIIGVNEDVTERKKSERELKSALNELTELKQQIEAENIYLKQELKLEGSFDEIVGSSKSLTKILKQVEQVAKTDSTVLLLGETGTGKELIAKALHDASDRKDKPLVKVNCSALPAELIESELFGHEKGAFTSAVNRKIGRFELANGGTIFLDEIGDLPIGMQTRLLRVLQESEFERVGGETTIKVDVRVITATNRNLEGQVLENKFRKDLYYRLNVFPITCPPLRDRIDDIPSLVHHFVNKYNHKVNNKIKTVSQKSIERLMNYKWPGNIRELEHVIERAVIVNQGEQLRLGKWFTFNGRNNVVPDELKTLEVIESNHIKKVLKKSNWKIRGKNGAAEILGLKPTTLEARIKKLKINRPI